MKIVFIIFMSCLFLSSPLFAGDSEEITARYVKDNKNYIYMESETMKYKLKKKELTKEGIKQILANKEVELTLFVPPKSIVYKDPKPEK